MKNAVLKLSLVLVLMTPSLVAAQTTATPLAVPPPSKGPVTILKPDEAGPRFVLALTNVQIELTLTDQAGAAPPDKKIVSMIAASGNWGKVRSAGNVIRIGEAPYVVELNVDARPSVSVDGLIRLELTLEYAPIKGAGDPKVGPPQRPSGINQSQTVVLHSGKSLMVSQAADPISDRKVTVEVKATVLK